MFRGFGGKLGGTYIYHQALREMLLCHNNLHAIFHRRFAEQE